MAANQFHHDQKAKKNEMHGSDFTPDVRAFLEQAIEALEITGRGYEKLVKVGRTIADLEMSEQIQKHHLQEAMAYRKIRLVV